MFNHQKLVKLDSCLACGSDQLRLTLDLGYQPLANSYKKTKEEVQEEYPLAVNLCKDCFHVQLTHAVNPDLMFKDYLYVSGTSDTMRKHFEWFANYATEYFNTLTVMKAGSVLDIGCNDGSQLDAFKKLGLHTIGIDPAENLYKTSSSNHIVFKGYFDLDFVINNGNYYDILVAQNVFAHNYDPKAFLTAARNIMRDESLLFIQTSQADMIKNNEFDTIYHEHISFYNTNSMHELCKRSGMYLIDVTKCPLHGNSYIFVVSKSKRDYRPAHIQNLIAMEGTEGLYKLSRYEEYGLKAQYTKQNLDHMIKTYRGRYPNCKVVGYGAAAKGMTMLNFTDIYLDWIVDDNPLKQGRFTPGSSIPILGSDSLKTTDKILFIPLAWNFFDEIRTRIKTLRPDQDDIFLKYFPNVMLCP